MYNPTHSCGRLQTTKYATFTWLAARFDEQLEDNPNTSVGVADFMKLVRKHYAIDVTENQPRDYLKIRHLAALKNNMQNYGIIVTS